MQALVIRHGRQLIRVPLPAAEVTLGSSPSTDITLPFPGVSRLHAHLIPIPGGAILTDAGSKNRLVVDGVRTDRAELRAGVQIGLGRAVLTIEDASTGEIAPAYPLATEGRVSRRQAKTESQSEAADDASRRSRAALAFIRDLEALSPRSLHGQMRRTLASARVLLECDWLFAFEQHGDADLSITASTGRLPSSETLDRIALEARSLRRDACFVRSTPDGDSIVAARVTKKRTGGLAAGLARKAARWEADVLEYLALKFVSHGEEKTGISIAEGPLVTPPEMVNGSSPAMTSLLSAIAATVRSRLDVLLLGETGTGKELIARTIHASGPTAGGPFVAINCAAIPGELLESQLFGVQGRVATGVDPGPGLFLQANGGSIFLDEIGELAEALQPKLLRVLQEREILPVGASTPRKIDVRVIAASNRDLLERAKRGAFRADLYYRLRGLEFILPPLRERKEDIPSLALAFTSRAAEEYGKRVRGISRRAMEVLLSHDWPGNVRELQSAIARAVLLCFDGEVLQREHLRVVEGLGVATTKTDPVSAPAAPHPPAEPRDLQSILAVHERAAIVAALAETRGNQSRAADLLGITRNGLTAKMVRYGLRPPGK
jgi:DNA-binding NtrC family response regulator